MSGSRPTYGYVNGKSYLKPSSPDLKDFWIFHDKYQNLLRKQPCHHDNSNSATTSLGVPRTFNRSHTVPFVCVSSRSEQTEPERAGAVHESLRQFVRFKSKQSYGKVMRQIEYQKGLPIYRFKGEIVRTVNRNSITIIAGRVAVGRAHSPSYTLPLTHSLKQSITPHNHH